MNTNLCLALSLSLWGLVFVQLYGEEQDVPIPVEKTEADFIDEVWVEPIQFRPVVQFSCCVSPTPEEDAWVAKLSDEDSQHRLAALGYLIAYAAPSSVPLQYKAYLGLKDIYPDHQTIQLCQNKFSIDVIKKTIQQDSPMDRFDRSAHELFWSMRAVACLQAKECIPRLLELSNTNNVYCSLAAEKTIEELDGPEAEAALIHVVSLWKYNAAQRAAETLISRQSKDFAQALLLMRPPKEIRYHYALWLGRFGNAAAVPILCEEVPKISIIDMSMFSRISALGRPEDRVAILALPSRVRENQQESAADCVKVYLERMAQLEVEVIQP